MDVADVSAVRLQTEERGDEGKRRVRWVRFEAPGSSTSRGILLENRIAYRRTRL